MIFADSNLSQRPFCNIWLCWSCTNGFREDIRGLKACWICFSQERLQRVPFKNLLWYSFAYHRHFIIIIISSSSSSSSSLSLSLSLSLSFFFLCLLSLSLSLLLFFLFFFQRTAVALEIVPEQPSAEIRLLSVKTEGKLHFCCSAVVPQLSRSCLLTLRKEERFAF